MSNSFSCRRLRRSKAVYRNVQLVDYDAGVSFNTFNDISLHFMNRSRQLNSKWHIEKEIDMISDSILVDDQSLDPDLLGILVHAVENHLTEGSLGDADLALPAELWSHHGLLEHVLFCAAAEPPPEEDAQGIDHDPRIGSFYLNGRHGDDVSALSIPVMDGRVDLFRRRDLLDQDDLVDRRKPEHLTDFDDHSLAGADDEHLFELHLLQDCEDFPPVLTIIEEGGLDRREVVFLSLR